MSLRLQSASVARFARGVGSRLRAFLARARALVTGANGFPRKRSETLRLDRHWQIALGVALLLLVAGALALGPVVRTVASARARERGLELDIGSVRPGWFSIALRDASVRLTGAPALSARFDLLRVRFTPWLSVREVGAHGGQVMLEGSLDQVTDQLSAWRAARRGAGQEGSSEGGARIDVHVEGLSLSWTGLSEASIQTVSGIRLDRQGRRTRAGFDGAELELPWARLRASGASIDLTEDSKAIGAARIAEVVGRVILPSPSPEPPEENKAALATPKASAAERAEANGKRNAKSKPTRSKGKDTKRPESKPAIDTVEAVAATPGNATNASRNASLAARAEQAWPALQTKLASLRAALGRVLSDGADLELDSVQLELERGASVLNVGPAPFELKRRGDMLTAAFTSAAEKDGKRLTVTGRLPLIDAPIEVALEGGPISLHTLGVHEGDFGLIGTAETALTLATRVELSTAGTLDVEASGRLRDLGLSHAALAQEPLRDMDLEWGGQIRLDLGERSLSLENGRVGLSNVQVQVAGSIAALEDDLTLSLRVKVPETPCQDLLAAAPRALLPQLEGLRLGGSFALDSSVDFDTRSPKDTRVEWNFDNGCSVLETPEAVDPQRFREPFQHYVLDADGRAMEITTGPTTDHWVPLKDITPNMETALIVCEDSRFFSHNGFDNKAIRDSIIDNLQAGHFVRGGSTLSMQLAKNLYLGREKTLSRKLQEAAFTLLLEERLSKEDILELYLNVVEFGPGIYGIRSAAAHYFNSHPGELSLAQALYLASVLPSPKANHFDRAGALRTRWAEHLHYLMRIARKINRITDAELEAGLSERLVFGQAHPSVDSDVLFETPLFELSDG